MGAGPIRRTRISLAPLTADRQGQPPQGRWQGPARLGRRRAGRLAPRHQPLAVPAPRTRTRALLGRLTITSLCVSRDLSARLPRSLSWRRLCRPLSTQSCSHRPRGMARPKSICGWRGRWGRAMSELGRAQASCLPAGWRCSLRRVRLTPCERRCTPAASCAIAPLVLSRFGSSTVPATLCRWATCLYTSPSARRRGRAAARHRARTSSASFSLAARGQPPPAREAPQSCTPWYGAVRRGGCICMSSAPDAARRRWSPPSNSSSAVDSSSSLRIRGSPAPCARVAGMRSSGKTAHRLCICSGPSGRAMSTSSGCSSASSATTSIPPTSPPRWASQRLYAWAAGGRPTATRAPFSLVPTISPTRATLPPSRPTLSAPLRQRCCIASSRVQTRHAGQKRPHLRRHRRRSSGQHSTSSAPMSTTRAREVSMASQACRPPPPPSRPTWSPLLPLAPRGSRPAQRAPRSACARRPRPRWRRWRFSTHSLPSAARATWLRAQRAVSWR
mmetsp:Transcript_7362/g.21078  ORF Transcript_7362/g.21078 Transcript_7362/m.21078 type:complete len:502 (+) Transcript_7362:4528-6033(+)